MNPAYICLVALVLAPPVALPAADTVGDVPAFSGPTPGVLRTISIPTVDISGEAYSRFRVDGLRSVLMRDSKRAVSRLRAL